MEEVVFDRCHGGLHAVTVGPAAVGFLRKLHFKKDRQIAAAQAAAEAAVAADRSYLKDLDKIWNTLRECDCGSWDESNTIFFDCTGFCLTDSTYENAISRVCSH